MMQLKRGTKLNIAVRALCAVLIAECVFGVMPPKVADAANKKITLKACRSLAIQESDAYASAEDAVASKKAAYESAVKAIALKEKSMSQFRWSPLLNFKFPTEPNMAEASEFRYKPVQLQYEIKVAEHKLQDVTFEISEKVNNLYVEIVVLQETIAFNTKRAEASEEGLKKNEAKLRLGQANKADVEKLKKSVETINNKIATDRRTLEADLQKLSNMIGMDVSTNYTFEKPFVEATIERDQLDALITYTEDRDEGYYEACTTEVSTKAELQTNAGLMRSHFGGDYNMISTYVNSALSGNKINKKAFKSDYKAFLTKIDSYWQGKKRIIFFKFPKVWFKGDMDGTRYIDDDPYVLYQNVLDYSSALNDKKSTKAELDQSVTDSFNNYISVRNSYKQYIKDVDEADANLKKDELRNRVGELSFEEYDSALSSYEELQNSMLDAMKLYSTTLYSFDRLTCGGVSAILSGTDADMQTAVVGESYIEAVTAKGPYYTLKPIIQNQEFELSIHVPDDSEVEITDFELWADGVKVGDRTSKDKKLRHLMLTVDNVSEVKIRLYNGDEFVDDCIIDPSETSGQLQLTVGYDIKKNLPGEIASYEITVNETTGMVELSVKPDNKDVKFFKIMTDDGKVLGIDEQIPIEKTLKYIAILQESLEDLKVEFYDESGEVLEKGRFDPDNGIIRREEN